MREGGEADRRRGGLVAEPTRSCLRVGGQADGCACAPLAERRERQSPGATSASGVPIPDLQQRQPPVRLIPVAAAATATTAVAAVVVVVAAAADDDKGAV